MSPSRDGDTAPRRISLAGLTTGQVDLLCTVLTAGEVPHAVNDGGLVTGAAHAAEVERALLWVRVDGLDEHFDDPEFRGTHAPVVKASRPPLADGRRQATRWRRVCGGLVDQGTTTVPALVAWQHDMPVVVLVAALFLATVPSTVLAGWSLGKLAVGTRLVAAETLMSPGVVAATTRWVVSAVPVLLVMAADMSAELVTPLLLVVYAPIAIALRGLHDYGAGTLVVDRSPAGPGIWVRCGTRPSGQHSQRRPRGPLPRISRRTADDRRDRARRGANRRASRIRPAGPDRAGGRSPRARRVR